MLQSPRVTAGISSSARHQKTGSPTPHHPHCLFSQHNAGPAAAQTPAQPTTVLVTKQSQVFLRCPVAWLTGSTGFLALPASGCRTAGVEAGLPTFLLFTPSWVVCPPGKLHALHLILARAH